MTERPEVLLSRADYMEDMKIRWQIHTYEWNNLCKDLNQAYKFIAENVSKLADKAYYTATDQ